MPVAHQRGLRHQRVVLELVFNGLWRHQLAARGLQQLLLAVGDEKESVRVQVSNVAGAKPSLRVETLDSCFRLVPVARKHRRPPNQQLSVFSQLELDVGQRKPRGAQAVAQGRIQGDHRRGLRQAIAFPKGNPHRGEPVRGVDPQRRAA